MLDPLQRTHALTGVVVAVLTSLLLTSTASRLDAEGAGSPCYERDSDNIEDLSKPQKCMPPFENVVAAKPVNVTPIQMTCGMRSQNEYCIQTHGIYRECDVCDDTQSEKRHPPDYLTDIHTDYNQTWWQSVTMLEDVHTQDINLTVSLGKAYDITYVRLKFESPRPASFAIYKKNRRNPSEPDPYPDEDWIAWQYYSVTCRDTYKMPDSTYIIQPRQGKTKINEDRALCTSDFSDMTPLTGANVAFSTLEGRPSGYNFEYSPELQSWVSATDIRISLQRLNTFGDEVFGDPKVLRSYYYGITDFTVGGRCQCNGHATHCIESNSDNSTTDMVCLCQHGTDGPNCDTCMPDHWDRPWRRATSQKANECKACECNQWSSRCRFNEQLYQETGRGGECMDCDGYRDGPHCERCLPNHFFSATEDERGRIPCEPCDCDATGSTTLQCSTDGQCECKPGVTGPKCDQCEANHWDFGSLGCKPCGCLEEGSLDNTPQCDEATGECFCKQNVEGQRCDRCKAGHFYIDDDNEFGCTPCFCYGHTSECEVSGGYIQDEIESDFSRSDEDWTTFEDDTSVPVKYDVMNKYIGIQSHPDPSAANPSGGAYFLAPSKYLGDQRASYNQDLTFKLRINDASPRSGTEDIVIVGGGAKTTKITLSIVAQNNSLPSFQMQEYRIRLHENPEFGWNPSLSAKDFMAVLANITAIKIRGTYVSQGIGFLDDVSLGSARRGLGGLEATWIERCQCPPGYQGQFCQLCVPGYHHDNGGPFARCVPCNCNGHADSCNAETGKCDCQDNTDGHNCEQCAKGFYGNALVGSPSDCQPCPCPNGGACLEIPGNAESPICTECPDGRTGSRCEQCEDGYYGDPMGLMGPVRECSKCDCNHNVDPNAIGNCDRTTGECLRCVDNTDGFHCERCKSGFFGDALALKKPGEPPNCRPCQCYPVGTNLDDQTYLPICNGFTGDCSCKPHVVGRDCDKCADGYFNLDSGDGCEPCNCDSIGSQNATCHVLTGQCNCNEGVTGQRCDMCLSQHYGFSTDGCKPCECDPTGSTDLQCDLLTGQCPCRDKVEGRRCDRCMENTRSRDTGGYGEKICEPCDDCYNLVSDATKIHRENLASLDRLLQQIAENPEPVGDEFKLQRLQLQVRVTATLADARISSANEDGATLRDRLEDLRLKLQDVINLVMESDSQIEVAKARGLDAKANVGKAKEVIDRARESLKNAERLLENQGREALRKAQERSKKFGEESEKMSAIAREARTLAEQQVEDASEIASIAEQAYKTSSDAYDMAYAAMQEQHDTENQIRVLESQVQSMGEKLRTVQSLAGQTHRDASEAYNTAINIYQQASSLEVPSVENEKFEDQANKVQREARRIREDAQRLIESNAQLLKDTQERRAQLEDLLARAEVQQQQLDAQLADMDKHRAKAQKAVDSGNSVLQDAANTLQTLKDFENTVNDNRESALEALQQVAAIEDVIQTAMVKTEEAREAMNGADTSASLALNVARDAQAIADEASAKAEIISDKAAESRQVASELSSATQSLTAKLADTKTRLEGKEEVAAVDGESALTALSKANQAQNKAKEASEKVEQAKKELDDIAAILSTVQEPEPGLLEELARRVEAAEQKFQAAELDLRLRDLEAAKQRQSDQVRDLERELSLMQDESQNVQAIRDSLPDFCPKTNDRCLENDC